MKRSFFRIVLFIFIFLFLPYKWIGISGQGIFDYLYYGVKTGANYTWFSNTQPHTSGKTGYMAGLTVEMRRYRRIFIVSGISYVRNGGYFVQIKNSDYNALTSYVGSNNISLHNIEIPLFARIFLRDGKQFLPYIFTGPVLVTNLHVTNDFERTLYLLESRLTYSGLSDLSSRFSQFYGNLAIGAGSEVLIANQSILFEIAYQYNLTPVNKSFSFLGRSDISYPLYMDGLQLNISYNF